MHTFEALIEDDRYTAPSLALIRAHEAEHARQLAAERLHASSHHQSVELHRASERLLLLSRTVAPRGADGAQRSVL
jgi:hypothetical protein